MDQIAKKKPKNRVMLTCTAKAEAVILTIHTTDGRICWHEVGHWMWRALGISSYSCSTTYFYDSTWEKIWDAIKYLFTNRYLALFTGAKNLKQPTCPKRT